DYYCAAWDNSLTIALF
nr:immunoglobulin light chain junction region [Macaca mulatta]